MDREQLVSVIIPVYNIKDYIASCVDSVISQTYHALEIILVDDGSTDGSEKVCDEYGSKDKRVVVLHKENGGLSDARNYGFNHSKGEYIMYVDGDDLIHPDAVKILMENAASNGAEISEGGGIT